MSEPPKDPPPAAPPKPVPPPQPLGSERNSTVLWGIVRKRPNPLISVAFTVPVFLFYHLGVLLVDKHSQVDFISTLVLRVVEASVPAYVVLTLALALLLLLTTWVQQKRGKIAEVPTKRVMWESAAAALVAIAALGYVSHRVLPGEASAISVLRPIEKIVLSLGSAFHEEFLFRALLVSGGTWALLKFAKWKRPWGALWLCMLVSSMAFAAVHYFTLYNEAFAWNAVGYRVLEAMLFAGLYVSRGFAVAVYAHAIYNLVTAFL